MNDTYMVIEILEHATILNSDGTSTESDAVHISRNGIHTGAIVFKPKRNLMDLDIHCEDTDGHTCFNAYEEFVKNEFISQDRYTEIRGGYRRHILTRIR
jgi:hypothetical protein